MKASRSEVKFALVLLASGDHDWVCRAIGVIRVVLRVGRAVVAASACGSTSVSRCPPPTTSAASWGGRKNWGRRRIGWLGEPSPVYIDRLASGRASILCKLRFGLFNDRCDRILTQHTSGRGQYKGSTELPNTSDHLLLPRGLLIGRVVETFRPYPPARSTAPPRKDGHIDIGVVTRTRLCAGGQNTNAVTSPRLAREQRSVGVLVPDQPAGLYDPPDPRVCRCTGCGLASGQVCVACSDRSEQGRSTQTAPRTPRKRSLFAHSYSLINLPPGVMRPEQCRGCRPRSHGSTPKRREIWPDRRSAEASVELWSNTCRQGLAVSTPCRPCLHSTITSLTEADSPSCRSACKQRLPR